MSNVRIVIKRIRYNTRSWTCTTCCASHNTSPFGVALDHSTSNSIKFLTRTYAPTALHSFLTSLLAVLRQKGYPSYPLIVTTNYDDILEHAFGTLASL
jgi:hypothetical protein